MWSYCSILSCDLLYTVTSVWLVSRYAASLQEVEAHIHEDARLRNELEDKAGIAERKGRLLKNGLHGETSLGRAKVYCKNTEGYYKAQLRPQDSKIMTF